MEMNSAKVLDEVCNQHNEAYSDEILYAAWAEPQYLGKNGELTLPTHFSEAVRANVAAFMLRLQVRQEPCR